MAEQVPVTNPVSASATAATVAATKYRQKTVWGIVLLTGPTALWIFVFALFAIGNLVMGTMAADAPQDPSSLFARASGAQVSINVVGFLLGAVAFFSWLPGIIVGIVLLATRTKPN